MEMRIHKNDKISLQAKPARYVIETQQKEAEVFCTPVWDVEKNLFKQIWIE